MPQTRQRQRHPAGGADCLKTGKGVERHSGICYKFFLTVIFESGWWTATAGLKHIIVFETTINGKTMRTDEFFYELFRFSPESLFKLVRLKVRGRYRFESITVKTTEKRIDGYFRSEDGGEPDVFLEVQGYPDNGIYWRLFREISTVYEQSGEDRRFVAIALFLDEKFDPGNPRLKPTRPNRLITLTLAECLKNVKDNATPLVVLKPLVLEDQAELPKAVEGWKAGIEEMGLPDDRKKALNDLLEYAILQRFKTLTLKEIREMIQLTPLEETVAGKELLEEGMEKGKLIGKIQLLQLLLKQPQTAENDLEFLDMEALDAMCAGLEAELAKNANWG